MIQFGVMSHTFVLTAEQGVPIFIYWSSGNIQCDDETMFK